MSIQSALNQTLAIGAGLATLKQQTLKTRATAARAELSQTDKQRIESAETPEEKERALTSATKHENIAMPTDIIGLKKYSERAETLASVNKMMANPVGTGDPLDVAEYQAKQSMLRAQEEKRKLKSWKEGRGGIL